MKIQMTLVEKRETEYKGLPQVKMTFVPLVHPPQVVLSHQNPNSKLTLFLTAEEADKSFPRLRAGEMVTISIEETLESEAIPTWEQAKGR